MPDLNLPADVDITAMPIGPYYPGLNAYESEFNAERSYSSSSPGSWQGSVAFGVADQARAAMGALLNGLYADMQGGQKTLGLPMPGPTITEPANATVVQAIEENGILTLDRDLAVPAGSVAGYPADHWVKIEERIYLIRAQPAADKIRVLPVAAAAIGERVHAADVISVRLDETVQPIERTPEFWGPVSFRWIEAV